jgi:hypothetical protein
VAAVAREPQGEVALLVPDVHLDALGQEHLHEAVVAAGAKHRGRVDVGAHVKQDAAHLGVAAAGRLHEAGLGAVLHVGLVVEPCYGWSLSAR